MNQGDRTTILVVGEGDTECAFLRHLKSQEEHRGERSISIRNARGGSPDIALTYAKRNEGGFDRVAILVDGDQLKEDVAVFQKRAADLNITAIVICPCIEALFLSLFDSCHDWSGKSTSEAKRLLHEKFDERKKKESDEYGRIAAFCKENTLEFCHGSHGEHAKTMLQLWNFLFGD